MNATEYVNKPNCREKSIVCKKVKTTWIWRKYFHPMSNYIYLSAHGCAESFASEDGQVDIIQHGNTPC